MREDKFAELLRDLNDAHMEAPVGSQWRHNKKGTVYEVAEYVIIEAVPTIGIVYSAADKVLKWCRPLSEFLDGRFTRVS
jgi:hypothetical protein